MFYWTNSEDADNKIYAHVRYLKNSSENLCYEAFRKTWSFSVRCIKDWKKFNWCQKYPFLAWCLQGTGNSISSRISATWFQPERILTKTRSFLCQDKATANAWPLSGNDSFSDGKGGPRLRGEDKLAAWQLALRRKKMSRWANIRGRRPNPCERDELVSGAVGSLLPGGLGGGTP